MTLPLTFSAEVAQARAAGTPIVALESTIITHGMPHPQNIEVARAVEADIRTAGAVPATIAVLDGQLHIGLETTELDALAQARNVAKLSRADLAACIARGGTGATTVAATMIAARLAGIAVFATGGIGGVHKGAEDSFDISADLMELAQTPVTVVAAGAKAILDVAKTLEVLETQGVPVIAVGQDSFPAFWSASSPLKAPLRMDDPAQIAKAHTLRAALGLPGGQLVANPIPAEDEIPAAEMAPVIAQAQADAKAHGISGKAVTPYLLQRIFELTDGRSLTANIALVRNNARLAAGIAAEIARQAA
ncbi:pseudouridine-5-phosphate glycosidase [Sulfitobacter alexandrii]|uniref:Pseudouridine-5'-phosphate glycosidase n=1 Tax=Sulfitobacter alexandrii TaxID=1917485 RepID=A0A1J0WGT5_9RHOB|nr:pseudouridine-5'-phosphate glycosidase [Sulfitobacter alexandrii]APE43342.1 pseudouridine-5-phosphate glycosidase [Sulfitobacter alexandrii]